MKIFNKYVIWVLSAHDQDRTYGALAKRRIFVLDVISNREHNLLIYRH